LSGDAFKVLFVCSRNRRRSLTAEKIFADVPGWQVRSAGTEDSARIKVTAGQLGWADVVVVMEKRHKERLRQKFPEEFAAKDCVCLFIPDDFEFMDAVLVRELKVKMAEHFPEPPTDSAANIMTEDIFDIVNERDEVIGRAPRSEVHAKGLLHRAVHVLIFNARGETFLQKRSMTKDREPGRWGAACSGHVDSGEDYDTAALRELSEELGWQPAEPLERVLRIEACRETDQEFVWIYRCHGEGPFTLNREEVETGGWFTPNAIDQWLTESPAELTSAFAMLWRLQRGKA
jgi:predicted protein tyrosine phosphatase/isopentenyldiphosphate isomerase